MTDSELYGIIGELRSRLLSLEAASETDRALVDFPEQRVNSFIPELSSSERVIAFGCTNDGLTVTVKQGKVYFKGVSKTITSWPTDGEVTISATTHAYIEIDLANATATWKTSASDPGNGDDETEIWRIFVATVADSAITELLECQHGDIHIPGNA